MNYNNMALSIILLNFISIIDIYNKILLLIINKYYHFLGLLIKYVLLNVVIKYKKIF